ncbi:MAG: hypothetical protein EB084_24020, partial [Proteobacteria bacterium]|nr:hypothetical protein [Pseudomonadota bacterium]
MNVLTDIETAFLSESDRLAEREPFDYAHPRLDLSTGHAAAWLLLKSRALEKAPVSFADLETALYLLEQATRLLPESPEGDAAPSRGHDTQGNPTRLLPESPEGDAA